LYFSFISPIRDLPQRLFAEGLLCAAAVVVHSDKNHSRTLMIGQIVCKRANGFENFLFQACRPLPLDEVAFLAAKQNFYFGIAMLH
jgi:hypothetical protein